MAIKTKQPKHKVAHTYRITPKWKGALTEGTIQEMERYDGKYDEVIRKGTKKHIANYEYHEEVIIKSRRFTLERWRTFGVYVEVIM